MGEALARFVEVSGLVDEPHGDLERHGKSLPEREEFA